MAGKNDIQKEDIEKLSSILDSEGILFGGAALPFYGVSRATEDVDFELPNASLEQINVIESKLAVANINGDITANASGWDMVPMPEGYKDRAIQTNIENIKVLHPLDFIASKLRRGTNVDFEDCLDVCKAQKISGQAIFKHLEKVTLPADPASNLFIKRVKTLAQKIDIKTPNA